MFRLFQERRAVIDRAYSLKQQFEIRAVPAFVVAEERAEERVSGVRMNIQRVEMVQTVQHSQGNSRFIFLQSDVFRDAVIEPDEVAETSSVVVRNTNIVPACPKIA